jgi:DNA-directed RNA polymerase specialized sigma24 family protein
MAWCYRVASTSAADMKRKASREPASSPIEVESEFENYFTTVDSAPDPARVCELMEVRRIVEDLAAKGYREEADMAYLTFICGHTILEAAKILKLNVGAAKMGLYRFKQKVKEVYERDARRI